METCCLVRILEPPRPMAEARHTDTATQNKARARRTGEGKPTQPGSQETGPGLSGFRDSELWCVSLDHADRGVC